MNTAATKRKALTFRKGALIYTASLTVLIIIALFVFYLYIGAYEKSRPENAAKCYSEALDDSYVAELIKSACPYPDADEAYFSACASALNGEYAYRRNSREYTNEKPSYIISCGGRDVLTVIFEKYGKAAFGFPVWDAEAQIINPDYYGEFLLSADVTVPVGSTVYIDGEALTDGGAVTAEKTEYPGISPLEEGIKDELYLVSYRIGGLTHVPVINAANPSGELILSDPEKNIFLFANVRSDYSYTVPEGTVLTLNGITLGGEYITQRGLIPDDITVFEPNGGVKNTVYTVTGLHRSPEVSAVYNGEKLELDENGTAPVPDGMRYNVIVSLPEGGKLYINGVEADSSFIEDGRSVYENLDRLADYTEQTGYVTYNVAGLYGEPEIRASYGGNGLTLFDSRSENGNISIKYYNTPDAQLTASIKDISEGFIKAYIYFNAKGYENVENNHNEVMSYVLYGTPAYKTLRQSFDSVKWNSAYATLKYNSLVSKTVIRYSDTCISCDVSFDVTMGRFNGTRSYVDTFRLYWVLYREQWYLGFVDYYLD